MTIVFPKGTVHQEDMKMLTLYAYKNIASIYIYIYILQKLTEVEQKKPTRNHSGSL